MLLYDSQKGITLLETILVLAIGISLIIMGMRVYQMYNLDRNLQQVNYNVDLLFQGIKSYYSSICPTLKFSSNNPYPVNIPNLVTNGFLNAWPPYQSSIVDSTSYVAQLNLGTTTTRNISQCYKNLNTNVVTCSNPQNIKATDTVAVWTLQVAVKVNDPLQAQAYMSMLSADCLSTLTDTTVAPCSAGTPGNYLVWTRLPSLATPNAQSDYWMSIPILKQFNQQYTNDDFYAFGTNDPAYDGGAYQTYLCGG